MWYPENLKDWVEMIATGGGVLGALVLFWVNAYTNRKELRRRHAEAGRSLITEMCDDVEAQNAFRIIDMEDGATVTLTDKNDDACRPTVSWDDALDALSANPKVDAGIRRLVREAFDALFYYFALFDHCIESGLVEQSDIEYPSSYYIRILADSRYRRPFADYLERHGLQEAQMFLIRWPTWASQNR
jgi:hypothetical protein